MREPRLKLLFSREHIARRVNELAREINAAYGSEPVTALCVLKGAVFFFADLVRQLCMDVDPAFIHLASYGDGVETQGAIDVLSTLDTPVSGKHVLVVEDVVDTGLTLHWLLKDLAARNPASVRVCALLDKEGRRRVDVPVQYAGFRQRTGFVVGCGMDMAGRYRCLDAIHEIVDSTAQ